jgi:hypothetical protein
MSDSITIRYSSPDDAGAVARLAALDGRPVPNEAMLLGFAGDELRAALSLAGGEVLADPFQRTAELVTLLRLRARCARRRRLSTSGFRGLGLAFGR